MECTEIKRQFREVIILKLMQRYSKVIMRIIRIFQEKKVNIEELITALCFNDVERKTIFSSDVAFSVIRTELQLFHHVAKYCKGIYDYQLLDVLVQASGCPEAIKELTDFTELRQNSIVTELDLMSEWGDLLHPGDFMPENYKFIIEYVGSKFKIETKEMIVGIVNQCVRLGKGILVFKDFVVSIHR